MPTRFMILGAALVAAAVCPAISSAQSNPLKPRPYGLGTTVADSLRYFAQRLLSEDPAIRDAAFAGISAMGKRAETLSSSLATMTTHIEPAARVRAAEVLSEIAPPEIALPALRDLTRDSVEVVRVAASAAIARYGPDARSLLPLLRSASGGSTEEAAARSQAIAALGGKTKGTPETIAKAEAAWIAEQLRAVSPIMRRLAALGLHEMGATAKPATAALIKALGDSDPTVRRQVAEALFSVDPNTPETRRALLARVADSTEVLENRIRIFRRTAGSGAELRQPIERRLLDQLKSHDDAHRYAAASLLGEVKEPLPETVAALAAALEDPSTEVRISAANALGSLGPAARDALEAMKKALRGTDPRLRMVIEISIARVDQ